MKKALLTILLTSTFIVQAHALFQFIDTSGNGIQTNGNGQYQIAGQINGNRVNLSNNGVQVSGPGGFFSIGNSSGMYGGNASGILGLIQLASRITGMLVPIMIALAVLAFFWYLIIFIWKSAEDPKKHADAMKGMAASVIAIFVMVAIWGIIGFISATLGIGIGGGIPDLKLPGFK